MILDFHSSEPGMPGFGFESETLDGFMKYFEEWLKEWIEALADRPEQKHEVTIRITQ